MILPALHSYYERLVSDPKSGIAPPGFQHVGISFVIVLWPDGRPVCFRKVGDEKAPARELVPQAEKRTVKVVANLLWDTPNYVLGVPKARPGKDEESSRARSVKEHAAFVARIREAFPDDFGDAGIDAVRRFLDVHIAELRSDPLWPEVEATTGNVTFQLKGDSGLVCQRSEVVRRIEGAGQDSGTTRMQCLVTGRDDPVARLHAAIKGVRGSQTTGANIVSFNHTAFTSHGREQGENAPVGGTAAFAYTTALNHLLRPGSRQRLQVGESTCVFWAGGTGSRLEEEMLDLFEEPPKDDAEIQTGAVRELLRAVGTGVPPSDEDLTPFYVLGLSPNASRLSVRVWHQGTVDAVRRAVARHFEDFLLVHGPKDRPYLSVLRLLGAVSAEGKAKNVPPNLEGGILRAVFGGTPYPRTLLAAAVRRSRAEQGVTHARAAVLKAVLVRNARFHRASEKEVDVALDPDCPHLGYQLGRLFAVLERLQETAIPGVEATIRERFFGAASATPATVFGRLMKLSGHHLAKIESPARKTFFDKKIGEIVERVPAEGFPAHLMLDDQGRFAVGYYHQRQDFFRSREEKGEK